MNMLLSKILLVLFLSCTFVLANDELKRPQKRGLGDWIVNIKNEITSTVSSVIQYQKNLLSRAFGSVVDTINNIFGNLLDLDTIFLRISSGIINNSVVSTVAKKFFQELQNTMKKECPVAKDLLFQEVTARSNVTYSDLIFVLSTFGDTLLDRPKEQLLDSLQAHYAVQRKSVVAVSDSTTDLFCQTTIELQDTLVNVLDVYTNYITLSTPNLVKSENKYVTKTIETIVRNADAAMEALVHGAEKFGKAQLLLAEVSENIVGLASLYALDKLADVDKRDVELAIGNRVNQLNEIVNESNKLINEVVVDVRNASDLASKAGINLAVVLPQIEDYFQQKKKTKMIEVLNQMFEKMSNSLDKTLVSIETIGEIVKDSGDRIKQSSLELNRAIPKFGLGLLSQKTEFFEEHVRESFKKQEDKVSQMVLNLAETGRQLSKSGEQISKSSWEMSAMIPTFGLRPLRKE